jgi:hypothetical protein
LVFQRRTPSGFHGHSQFNKLAKAKSDSSAATAQANSGRVEAVKLKPA